MRRLRRTKILSWLYEGHDRKQKDPAAKPVAHQQDAWWRVMCLTGVDYFSSMGFQPSVAFVAAGLLSPLATFNLVLLTLFGALPSYFVVARESPHGQGSFSIFERFLPGWKGKTLILILLGFAVTDFIFTITMCAADATAHIVENPLVPRFSFDRIIVTSTLIIILGLVFLKGFEEAVKISFWLVLVYLSVNAITLYVCCTHVQPQLVTDWWNSVLKEYGSVGKMILQSIIVFPQLALGLSGFETGVAVMPLIRTKTHGSIDERITKTRYLLFSVAVIMAAFLLLGTSLCTLLIRPELFKENGPANGRALAYLTHLYLGEGWGTLYDISTVSILWFAGASGMAALLSLVPQYLPRYGMAPDWTRARRPLVLIVTVVSLAVTLAFQANVDSQAGAFATGLLVLISSATTAVTLATWHKGIFHRILFSSITLAFIYSSIAIISKRPDGLQISIVFTISILASSLISRALRSTELRINEVKLDEKAEKLIEKACKKHWGEVRLLAHKPDDQNYADKAKTARRDHSIQHREGDFIFLEVTLQDASDFIDTTLEVTGHRENDFEILRCSSPTVPNAIAAVLLHVRDKTEKIPHVYFGWTEGHPLGYIFKYILFGEGETAPLTREILRSAEPDPEKRPQVHVS